MWTEEEGSKKQLKRYLGQCSLVCRYWAKHSRRRIFESITLRTPEDAIQLLEFAKVTAAGMSIGMYTSNLALHVTLASPPWIHLVINAIPSLVLPEICGFTLIISGGPFSSESIDDPKSLAPRNIFYGLPRSLPPTKRPVSLTLGDMRFNAFDDFVSFVDSVMATKPVGRTGQTTFSRISWLDNSSLSPDATPRAFNGMRRCWRKLFPTVAASGCTAAWPLLWLVVTTQRPRKTPNQSPLFVDGAEVHRLAGLIQIVMDDCHCAVCDQPSESSLPTFIADNSNGGLRGMRTRLVLQHEWPLMNCAPESLEAWNGTHELIFSLSDGFVTKVDFVLVAPYYAEQIPHVESPEAFSFNWAVLDTQVAAFNATMSTFRVQIPDAMYTTYEPFVRVHLPVTGASGKLKVERLGGKSGDKGGKV